MEERRRVGPWEIIHMATWHPRAKNSKHISGSIYIFKKKDSWKKHYYVAKLQLKASPEHFL